MANIKETLGAIKKNPRKAAALVTMAAVGGQAAGYDAYHYIVEPLTKSGRAPVVSTTTPGKNGLLGVGDGTSGPGGGRGAGDGGQPLPNANPYLDQEGLVVSLPGTGEIEHGQDAVKKTG